MSKPIETLAGADATAFQAAIAPHVAVVAEPLFDAEAVKARRIRTLETLRASIARTGGREPELMAAAGNGNRDWATGSDGAHPTMLGHHYFASRAARGIAGAIRALIAAQG